MNSLYQILREPTGHVDRQAAIDEAREASTHCALVGVALAGCDLSGLYLARIEMRDLDFRRCLCRKTTFPPLINCMLDGVDAGHSYFPRIERCKIRRASLSKAYFGARITECDFSESKLRFARFGQNLCEIARYFRGNDFSCADLHGIDAAGAYLAGTCFGGARLTGARLSRADLSECDVRNADFTGSNLVRASLTGANIFDAAFAGCVVTAEQGRELRDASPYRTSGLKIVSHAAGPFTALLERQLESLKEYNLDWEFRLRGTSRREKLLLWKDDTVARCSGAGAFRSDRVPLQSYSSEGARALSSILLDMAADYANWQIDPESVDVQVNPPALAGRVAELVHGMLSELFNND